MLIDLLKSLSGEFEYDYTGAGEAYKGTDGEVAGKIQVRGEYNPAGDDILVSGKITYDAVYPCARCLTPVKEHYELPFEELFTAEADADYKITEDEIDLDPLVHETIVLNIPGRVLCKEDCKGLCPVCGTNLNKNKCNCNTTIDGTSGDNPFAVLLDITTGGAGDGSTKKKNFKTKA